MKQSAISWTDYSGGDCNFVTGCTPVSAGCANCYARAIYRRFGKAFDQVQTHAEKLERLARARFPEWTPKRGPGHRPMAFVVDTGDLFHEAVPEDFVRNALDMMAMREDVIWQVLTKRPERMREIIGSGTQIHSGQWVPPPNLWLGVTAENQATADERIPILLDTPATVRFVSCEPLLEDLDCIQMGMWLRQGIHWVIVGGESGPKRRLFDPEWAHNLLVVCRAMHTPFFFKQGSALKPGQDDVLPGVGLVKEWPV